MDTGTKISGILHLGLIGTALLGGVFQSRAPEVEVQNVAVISGAEFAALVAAQAPPETGAEPAAPAPPDQTDDAPDAPATPTEPEPDQSVPDSTPEPAAEATPETLPAPLPPQPETEATDTAPSIEAPQDLDVPLPPASVVRPQPRQAERIAPVPVAAPPPDVRPDEVARPDTTPDPGAEDPKPEEEATAPEEATDRVAPETTDSASLAPAASVRPPRARPNPPAARSSTQDAVNAALQEALGGGSETAEQPSRSQPAASGPPLTSGEKSDLIFAVSSCWNVGSLSSAALETTVVVAVEMTEDAKPVVPSIRMLSSSGGTQASAAQAFQAARRAIIRCGAKGYDLPADKYGQWREIEMTFNPERMRIR